MKTPRAHNPAARWTMCEKCRHRGYFTRSDARAVRKRHREKGLTIFLCPHRADDAPDLFHLGHQPTALGRGDVDRARMVGEKRAARARFSDDREQSA